MRIQIIIIFSVLFVLTACQGQGNHEIANNEQLGATTAIIPTTTQRGNTMASAEPTSINTEIPFPTGTREVPPEVVEMLRNDPFFASQQPSCELPCWFDLQIGNSTLEDVYQVLEEDFEIQRSLLSTDSLWGIKDENVHTLDYSWDLDSDVDVPESTDITIMVAVDRQTELYLGLQMMGGASSFDDVTYAKPLEQVFELLGPPDHVMFEKLSFAIRIYITYYSGLHFDYSYDRSVAVADEMEVTTLCFDDIPDGYAQYIVATLDGVTIDTADPVQREWIFEQLSLLESDVYAPFAEDLQGLLNLTPQELTELVVSGEQICFEIDLSQF